ncbi:receptor-type tyrosine-protein phosphatase H-like [Simochromis diagramma]|uniref:receptor-type tyrosine-protein phosphatase H-like n=1 Tax=Simochromis diagramma TaxID=43689 RepID=UPI001A7E37CE|nr:receptor-type tyrosine-protein phosphatase H-like [Simochromis diagramma]
MTAASMAWERQHLETGIPGSPNNLNGQKQCCVALLSGSLYSDRWDDRDCGDKYFFVCYNGTINGEASFVKVDIAVNWTDAQSFCRKNYVDLASVRNQTESQKIAVLAKGVFVWIGLYRQKVWSDGTDYLFQYWATGQPDSGNEQCVAADFSDSGRWSDELCSKNFPSICFTTINFRSTAHNESSITLQWNKVNNNVNFIFQFNSTEANISAPAGNGPVNHTVSSLTAGTKYIFTLYSVLESIKSSGVSITAFTIPPKAETFRSLGQNETSITLQWNKVNNNVSFVLQFNGTETKISAPAGNGPVNHTVSSLTAGTQYTFTLYSVFENVRSSGVSITAVTAPSNAQNLISSGQNETSITLQWNKVNNNVSFVLQFNGTETNISAPAGNGPVNHTVSSLTAGTQYTFTLYSVFENVRSSGVSITAVTAPSNAQNLISSGQNETSITLQWKQVNNNVSFVLHFNGTETSISAPAGNGPVTHTVSSLTAGTQYTFTLYSVFENIRSSGVSITAVTAPSNAQNLISSGQNETSITLQWNKVNNNVSFVLQFNGTETSISAPAGNGPVIHTVSSLTAGTQYTFTLYSVFENIRSSGVSITAVTGPNYVVGMKIKLRSFVQLSDLDIQDKMKEFFRQYGLLPQFSFLKVKPVQP